MNRSVTVLLVDDQVVVREAICTLIDQQPHLAVVAQVGDVDNAGRLEVTPDVVVTDIDFPNTKHAEVIRALRRRFPHASILVLTSVRQPATVQLVLAAGADGYMLKTATAMDLFTGIRSLARGESHLQPSLGVDLARWHRSEAASALSMNELKVLRLVALGHTNVEVARICCVSLRTVEARRGGIQQKLGRSSRADLVQYALNLGLLEPDGD